MSQSSPAAMCHHAGLNATPDIRRRSPPCHSRPTPTPSRRRPASPRARSSPVTSCLSMEWLRLPTGSSPLGRRNGCQRRQSHQDPGRGRSRPPQLRRVGTVLARQRDRAFRLVHQRRSQVRRNLDAARTRVNQLARDRRRAGRFRAAPEGPAGRRYRRPREHLGRPSAACCRRRRRTQARHRADDRRKRARTVRTGCRPYGSRRSAALPHPVVTFSSTTAWSIRRRSSTEVPTQLEHARRVPELVPSDARTDREAASAARTGGWRGRGSGEADRDHSWAS